MYLRMLKRDLRDKVGLNIILFVFMIIASTLLVISSGFIYTFFVGSEKTYEKCNTSDFMLLLEKSMSDYEGQKRAVTDMINSNSEMSEILVSDRPFVATSRMEFEGVDKKSVTGLYEAHCILSPVVREGQNIPYDLNDESFILQDGCVALSQTMASHARSKIGDSFTLTTDMGNTYEFKVANIYKEPSTADFQKVLFSDSDYEALCREFPCPVSLYECTLKHPYGNLRELADWGNVLYNELYRMVTDGDIDGTIIQCNTGKTIMVTNEGMVSLIIGIFMGVIGFVLILLVFMSIRFSLKSTIKREEKEIGTMKAIGVDSLSYKSLFIVKYIAFAIVGGVIGFFIGTPVSRYMISRFILNTISPSFGVFLIIGILATMAFVFIMTFFSFIALRRMKRISVMDTIHGENRGERFKKLPGVSLHKSRKMSIPFFLAAGDVMGRVKRYLYLIISFTLGIVVVFMLLQLKSTIVSDNYRRTYWQHADREVFIRPDEGFRDKLIQQEGSYRNVFLYYERFFNENGVPLNIQIADMQRAFLLDGDEEVGINLYFGDYEPERLTIVEGNTPKEPNEVVVAHKLKEQRGIQIGDTITLEYVVYSEDGFTRGKKTADFLVTGYLESFGYNSPIIYTAGLKDHIVPDDWDLFNAGIDADGAEYDAAIERMRELMPNAQIWDYDQVMDFDLGNLFGRIINLLILVVGIILAVTFASMIFLYEEIFIEEETADIAMLKSMGIDKLTIRKWHFERMMILAAIAALLAIMMAYTLNKLLLGALGASAMAVDSFIVANPPAISLIIVPLLLAAVITLVMLIALKPINEIQIWRGRNE